MKRMLTVLAAVISAAAVRVATADVEETKSTLSGGVLTLDVKSGDTLNYTQLWLGGDLGNGKRLD